MKALPELVATLLTAAASDSPFAVGTVTATSPLTVRWNGATVVVTGKLASYTPAVNNVVLMARIGPQLIALGSL